MIGPGNYSILKAFLPIWPQEGSHSLWAAKSLKAVLLISSAKNRDEYFHLLFCFTEFPPPPPSLYNGRLRAGWNTFPKSIWCAESLAASLNLSKTLHMKFRAWQQPACWICCQLSETRRLHQLWTLFSLLFISFHLLYFEEKRDI